MIQSVLSPLHCTLPQHLPMVWMRQVEFERSNQVWGLAVYCPPCFDTTTVIWTWTRARSTKDSSQLLRIWFQFAPGFLLLIFINCLGLSISLRSYLLLCSFLDLRFLHPGNYISEFVLGSVNEMHASKIWKAQERPRGPFPRQEWWLTPRLQHLASRSPEWSLGSCDCWQQFSCCFLISASQLQWSDWAVIGYPVFQFSSPSITHLFILFC